jgi:hypothetical protein
MMAVGLQRLRQDASPREFEALARFKIQKFLAYGAEVSVLGRPKKAPHRQREKT